MKEIKKNYLALIPNALWSWILCFIPTGIEALRIYFAKYTYNDEQIIIKTGVIHQNQESIPFYRLVDVKSNKNIIEDLLKVGKITLYDKNKVVVLKYIENPDEVANELRNLMLTTRKNGNVKVAELL
jgi:membrane protein YdbS with pleckstrin-like domain